jgi:hypothetical protein
MEPTTDMDGADMTDMGADDDFAASEPATGGDEEADRAKRESKDYSAKKAAAGKKYSSKADGKKVAGAVLKKLRAKESIDGSRLITALSKKK